MHSDLCVRGDIVSLHHGGGVGIGYSQHAGMVLVRDGSKAAARRIKRVLWNAPATGLMRHADAGYGDPLACAESRAGPFWHTDAMMSAIRR